MQTVQDIFRHAFRTNRWRNTQSVSGPGSTLSATRSIRETLPQLLADLQIRTLVDAPCGDGNWIRHLDYSFDEYIGADIVPELIERLREELSAPNRRFIIADIIADALPSAEGLLCRDCLVHLSLEQAAAAIQNWRRSGYTYLIVTTFPGTENRDVPTGRWRALDLQAPPFNLPPPLVLLRDGKVPKSLGVWETEALYGTDAPRRPRPVASGVRSGAAQEIPRIESARTSQSQPQVLVGADLKTEIKRLSRLWNSDRRSAAILAEQLYAMAPDNREVANFHASSLFNKRDFEGALAVTAESLEKFDDSRFLGRLCLVQVMLQRPQDALATSERYFDHPALGGHALLFHGAVLHRISGELDPSVGFFHRAAATGHLRADHHAARQVMLNRDFEALTRIPVEPARNPIHFLDTKLVKAEAVVMASADETYFRALFDIYSSTFLAHNDKPGHLLHLHLFDPTPALLEEVATTQREYSGRIQFSYEHTGGNRSYYYAGRFVQVPRLLERYRCQVVVTDIDCYFRSSIRKILDLSSKADLGILEVDWRLCPWRNSLAGLVVFRNTEMGRRYASGMHNFLTRLPSETRYWYVDQLALLQCAHLSRNLGAGKVVKVNAEWRLLCQQGTGATGKPEVKAGRMRKRLVDEQQLSRRR